MSKNKLNASANIESRINISKAVYDQKSGRLVVKGWRLTKEATPVVLISTDSLGVLGEAHQELERKDVAAKNPEYGNAKPGWLFETEVSGINPSDVIRASLVSGGRTVVFETSVDFKAATNDAAVGKKKSDAKKKPELLFTKANYDPKRKRIILQAILVHGNPHQTIEFHSSSGMQVPKKAQVESHPQYGTKKKWDVEILCPALIDGEVFTARIQIGDEEIVAKCKVDIVGKSKKGAAPVTFRNEARFRVTETEYAWFLKHVVRDKPAKFDALEKTVVFYPKFNDSSEFGNHFYRAAWYLTGAASPVSSVVFGITENLVPDAPPAHFGEQGEDLTNFRLESSEQSFAQALRKSRVILIWKSISPAALQALKKQHRGAKIITVCTDDINAIEYGNYAKAQWAVLDKSERDGLIEQSRNRLAAKVSEIQARGVETAAVFGTGPSLCDAFEFDFSDCFTVACNTIVNSRELLDHIRPEFICAGDVVSHFGVSAYAAKFRSDLVAFLRRSDSLFFTTSDFGFLIRTKYPDLEDKVILCQQTANGPIVDLLETYALPKLDSTLNIHMLPLASTVADTVFILGCDGKSPDPENNEDFWTHASLAHYHDLVDTGHLSHPTFDVRRQETTHDRFINSTADFLATGEFMGRRYYSLKPSFTAGLKSRPVPSGMLEDVEGRLKPVRLNQDCKPAPENFQRILITARVNPENFSGGRYHAFLMAEAFARNGHHVTLWIDNVPKWYFNLALLPGHPNLQLHVNSFVSPPKGDFDWVVITPDFSDSSDFYLKSLRLAKSRGAKVGLINFESPNWFNEWSESKRPNARWRHWLTTSHFSDVIISSAEISTEYAKAYYGMANEDLKYVTVPPAINSAAADLVRNRGIRKKDQIVCISRFGSDAAHKNIEGLLPLMSDATRGHTLALIVGTGDLPDEKQESELRRKFAELEVDLLLLHNISDIEKFEVIGSSKCMVFQSLFEGFGYPPIEAQYLDCPCVAYDLPVLREFSENHVNFVELGSEEEMREVIADILEDTATSPVELYPNVAELGSVQGFAARLEKALFRAGDIPGGQVNNFRRNQFLSLSNQYEEAAEGLLDEPSATNPTAAGLAKKSEIIARHFHNLAEELERLSGKGS